MSRFFDGTRRGISRDQRPRHAGTHHRVSAVIGAAAASVLLTVGLATPATAAPPAGPEALPQLSAAQPGTLQECESLTDFAFPSTKITAISRVAAGTVSNGGQPIGEHCLVRGRMNERVSPVDGQTLRHRLRDAPAHQLERPLPLPGATAASTAASSPPLGAIGGGRLTSALQHGLRRHQLRRRPHGARARCFGIDPQARLDYGYQAVGKLTPMAKAADPDAYGKGPDRSYIGGCSNGGRHTMVAAARYADQYDGFLAGAPGFNLPLAAVAQHLRRAAVRRRSRPRRPTSAPAFTPAERTLVGAGGPGPLRRARRRRRRHGLEDSTACQAAFDRTATCRPAPARATARA